MTMSRDAGDDVVAGEVVIVLPPRVARRLAARDRTLLAIAAARVRMLEVLVERGAPVRWSLIEERLRWTWRLWRDGGRPALEGLERALELARSMAAERWPIVGWWERSPAACLSLLELVGLRRGSTSDRQLARRRPLVKLPAV